MMNIGVNRDDVWLLVGDFNEIPSSVVLLRQSLTFYPFKYMVRDCRIKEIPSSGNKLSWAGVRNDEWIQCCLDRAFGNAEWFRLFPRVHSEYFERLGSDHRPILTRFASENCRYIGRFYFDKRWCNNSEALAVIRRGWWGNTSRDRIFVSDCISAIRKELSKWKRRSNQNAKSRISQLRLDLDKETCKQFPNFQLMSSLKWDLVKDWKQNQEKHGLKREIKTQKYFHACVKSRKMKNMIPSLIDVHGT